MEEQKLSELKEKVLLLPKQPGIYQFIDAEGKILYIGKAKNLKNRVASYFNNYQKHPGRIQVMVTKIDHFIFSVVNTEYDALLLENNLIKKHQPRYNVNLKDGKTYPYIVIKNERFPRVFSTRRRIKDGSRYYGPYASVGVMKVVLDLVKSLFQIRSCNYDLSEAKIKDGKYRVCLDYHIQLCKGPCEGLQSEADYNNDIRQIENILRGKLSDVKDFIKGLMQEEAEKLNFEKAALYKEKLVALDKYQAKSTVVNPNIHNVDVFSIYQYKNQAFVNFLKVVNGAIIQTDTLEYHKKMDERPEDILALAIVELRERFESTAREIIAPYELEIADADFHIQVPKIGDKKKLLDLSKKNALFFYKDRLNNAFKTKVNEDDVAFLEQVKEELGLSKLPVHIECFDNSNFQGTHPVSAMVCFRYAKPSPKDYRHYNIQTVDGPDDFASMKEVVHRRYKRLLREGDDLPQLILIDGGKGQLSAAYQALEALEIEDKVEILGIAKKLEDLFKPKHSQPLNVSKSSPVLRLMQHLRDEAHRFGITHHRKRRSKSTIRSKLEDIPGVGKSSIKKLIGHFVSVKRIKAAPKEELAKVVGQDRAAKVYQYFQDER